jgi:hypothetical protein
MARSVVAQPSFARGELSPRLYGRVDTQAYQSGAEAIENFIVRPEGGLMRRHGTRFAGEAKDHTRVTRMVSFVFSTVQAYMLEFGHNYIRVWKDYAPITSSTKTITGITQANPAVVTATSHGFSNGDRVIITGVGGMGQVNNREFTVANQTANTFELSGVNATGYDAYTSGGSASKIYEIVSPYGESDLDALTFAQSADTLYIAHPSYAPRTLTRTAHTTWTSATLSLTSGPFAPLNSDDSIRVRIEPAAAAIKNYRPGKSITVYANADIFTADHVGGLFYMREVLLDQLAVVPWSPTSNAALSVNDQQSNDGNVYLAVSGTGGTGPIAPTHTSGDAYDNMTNAPNNWKWRYLHSRDTVVLITAFTSAKEVTATIISFCPPGFNQPSKTITNAANDGSGNIRITSTAHGLADGDYVFIASVGGTTEANGYWQIEDVGTNTFDLVGSTFTNAYTSDGTARRFATWLWAFGAFSAERGFPACVALHEQRLCFANTEAQPFGFWASKSGDFVNYKLGSDDDDTISYNIAANQVDPVRWLASASDLLIGTLAQELAAYGGGLGNPITPTNTRIVPQSGEGSNGVPPVKVGTELVFVNRAGRKIFAALLQSDVGSYTATDLLELAEHLAGPGKMIVATAWAKNPMSVLWVLRSDGALLSMTYRRDQGLIAWARHPIDGTVESIAVIPSPDGTTDDLWLSVARTINGGTKRYIEYLAAPFEPESATDKDEMGFVDSGLRYSGSAAATVTGLWHLEGQTVKVVAGGAVHPDCVVTSGKITLDASYANVWVGLAYTSRLRTLRLEGGAMGTAQAKTKRPVRITVRVLNAIGGKAGPGDEATMEELVRRELDDPMDASPPMRSGDYDVFPSSDFDTAGKIAVVQDEPLPLDILAVFPMNAVSEG